MSTTALPVPPRIQCVSVQSAKGGVGKTLISFLLADQLRKRDSGCRVVVLDLDFTGTSVANIKTPDGNGNLQLQHLKIHLLRNEKEERVELLKLFQQRLEAHEGDGMPSERELTQARKQGADRVIYITSGFTYEDGKSLGLLFDANHALWFCDFLFDLFESLAKGLLQSGQVLHVILDNAPGQSELAKKIQERLLHWGVHRARFLQVTSLDTMDIRACVKVLLDLCKQFKKIKQIKNILAKLCEAQSTGRSHDCQALWHKSMDRDLLEKWIQEDEPKRGKGGRVSLDDLEIKEPSRFVFLAFNRVFETVDLSLVGRYLFSNILDEYDKNRRNEMEKFFKFHFWASFPYDPALALMFQEAFQNKALSGTTVPSGVAIQSLQDIPVDPETISIVDSVLPAFSKEKKIWCQLIHRDARFFSDFFSSDKGRKDVNSAQEVLTGTLSDERVLHFLRGSKSVFRLLDFVYRLLERWNSPFPKGDFYRQVQSAFMGEVKWRFHDNDAAILCGLMGGSVLGVGKVGEGLLGDQTAHQKVFLLATINRLMPIDGAEPLDRYLVEAIDAMTEHNQHSGMMLELARAIFPIYGAVIICHGIMNGTLVMADAKAFLVRVWEMVVNMLGIPSEGKREQETLNAMWEFMEKACPGMGKELDCMRFEAISILDDIHWTEISVTKNAIVSQDLFWRVWKFLEQNSVQLSDISRLYLASSLGGLLSGLRDDYQEVTTELDNLFRGEGSGTIPFEGSLRMAKRLGRVTDQWMGNRHGGENGAW